MFLKSLNCIRNFSVKIGDQVSVKRMITAEDVKSFAALAKDHNTIHSSPEKGIVHGALLNALVSGVIGSTLPGDGTVVVQQNLRFPNPCFVGNEVTINVKVNSVRKLVEVDFEVFSEEEFKEKKIVLQGSAKLLIPFQKNSIKFVNSYGHDFIKV